MLLLCLTGLPLIFHEEIDHLTTNRGRRSCPAGTPLKSLDERGGRRWRSFSGRACSCSCSCDQDDRHGGECHHGGPTTRDSDDAKHITMDRGPRRCSTSSTTGIMYVILQAARRHVRRAARQAVPRLHGPPLFVAIISGVVLYAPFMRRLGSARSRKAPRASNGSTCTTCWAS